MLSLSEACGPAKGPKGSKEKIRGVSVVCVGHCLCERLGNESQVQRQSCNHNPVPLFHPKPFLLPGVSGSSTV